MATTPNLRPPKQTRSKRTLERIVRSSLEILETEGRDGLTVQAIVSRSHASVGSFYARFKGKDDLLEYLGEKVWREAAGRWDRALEERNWDELGLQGLVRGSLELLANVGRSRASVLTALGRAPGTGEDAFGAFQAHVLSGVERLLLERRAEIEHDEPAVAVRLGLAAAVAVLESGPRGDEETELPVERRIDEAERLLLSYLGAPVGAGGDTEQIDFFDVWG